MLDRVSLESVLKDLADEELTAILEGYFFRSITLRHFLPPKVPAPLYAARSGLVGTRFMPPNRPIAGLYLAGAAETAHREGNQPFYRASRIPGLDTGDVIPPDEVVLIGVRVRLRLAAILDVRSAEIATRLETSEAELRSPWKTVPDAPTQRLGEAVFESGLFEGLAYRSAQHEGGSCLLIFPDRLRAGSFVEFRSRTLGVPDARLAGPAA